MTSVLDITKQVYVAVSLVSDVEMTQLNKKYRNKDTSTDVLSFNIDDDSDPEKYYLGDVMVNKDQAQRQAGEYGNSLEQEIADLVSHGVLHLLGVHHEGEDH